MSAACQRMYHGLAARPTGGACAPCRYGRARQAPHRAGGAAVDRTHCGTDGDRCFQGWSEDGARLLSPGVDNSARLLYICVDPCRHAATAEGTRGHGIHPDPEITDRLSVAEEAAMIDLGTYVLDPLHQEGACLLSRGQLRGQRAEMVPALLVVAPVGDHPTPASLQRLEHEYALRAALDPAWAVRPLALVPHQGRPLLVLEGPGGEPVTRPP